MKRPDGSLEREVLTVLRSADRPLVAAEVRARVARPLAYTSIATVLGRLHQKGQVVRHEHGRSYAWSAAASEADSAAGAMAEVIARADDRHAVLARFVGRLSDGERRALHDLLADLDDEDRST